MSFDSQPIVAIEDGDLVDHSLPCLRDQLIGLRLDGRFELIEEIGAGGMSVVYKARQMAMDRFVAVKTMRISLAERFEGAARFRREIKSLAMLNHPHIVSVYDCIFSPEGQPYVVMDYLPGPTLAALLHDGPMEPARAVRLFMQMCSALEHAHKQGIIHRDLKPNNVIVLGEGDDEYVKVLDFGLAKLREETTKVTTSGEVFGSPPYMCPEQWRGEQCDARSDIYSFGVLMYEALVGKDPYHGSSYWSLSLKHMQEPPPSFKELNDRTLVDEGLEAIVMKCLQKDPADRFQSFAELKDALAQGRTNQYVSMSTPVVAQKKSGAGAMTAIVSVMLILMVVVLLGFAALKPAGVGEAPHAVATPNAVHASSDPVPGSKPETGSRSAGAAANAPASRLIATPAPHVAASPSQQPTQSKKLLRTSALAQPKAVRRNPLLSGNSKPRPAITPKVQSLDPWARLRLRRTQN